MKEKQAKEPASMNGGSASQHNTRSEPDSRAGPRARDTEKAAAYTMPNDAAADLSGLDERGMPGLTGSAGLAGRGARDAMPDGAMVDLSAAGKATDMPGADMGAGGGNFGGGGGNGGGSGGGGAYRPPPVRKCGTMDVHRRLLSTLPSYARIRAEIENHARLYELGAGATERSGVTRIPVVVHVVWNSAAQNVSDAQIASQMDVLNRDFRRTNPDANSTPAPYLPLATDSRIEFFLANTDPNGAPSGGVERRQTSVAAFLDDDAVKSFATGGLNAWPQERYLNMWVCPLGGGLLGYAQFPGGPGATDGVVIQQSAFGTTGTAAPPFNLGRTATHEIGHWLNLNHIWGDDGTGCSGTDNVADTPNQAGYNTGAPSFPHVSCGNAPHGDMFMNYMDYTDDRAMFMFTAGQVARMQACLDGVRGTLGAGAGMIRPSSSPVVAWEANRIDTFVLGTDRALYHKWWDGGAWGPATTGYDYMGGVCTSVPQAVAWGPNRLDVFVTGTDSALYHKWWDGGAWGPAPTGYEYMGGVCLGEPRVVSWGANRLDVFVIGSNHALYHKWWDGANWGPSLTDYAYMGGVCLGQPEVVSWGANRLDVFVIGADRALYHKWWDGANWGPSLEGYERLGGVCTCAPRAVAWGPNRLDVFVTGTDGALYHKWWDGANWGPSPEGFEYMGGVCVGQPEAVSWGANRLDLFVIGTDSALYHKWWDGGAWGPALTGYEYMGGIITSAPRVVAWGANRLDVFATGTDSALYHKWWDGGAWGPSLTGYEYMGGIITAFRQAPRVQQEAPAQQAVAPTHAVQREQRAPGAGMLA